MCLSQLIIVWRFFSVSQTAASSGLTDLLKNLLLLLEKQVVSPGLQAQGPTVVRTECVTSAWCGVRPARRNTSVGRAMQC